MKAETHWNHYRDLVETVGDLRALYEHAKERHAEVSRASDASRTSEFQWRARRAILKTMLDRSLVPGNKWPPPRWESLPPGRRGSLTEKLDGLGRAPRARKLLEGTEKYLDGRPDHLIPDTTIDLFREVIARQPTPYDESDAESAVENLRDFFRRRDEDFPSSPGDFVKKWPQVSEQG